MRKRLKNPKDAAIFRKNLLQSQNYIDPIIKETITDPVLDHNHQFDQECRAVLERTVNSFEGKVQNAYIRYIKHLTDKDLPTILRNLADYYENDYSENPIHHTALTIDVNKFKRMPAQKQIEILESTGLIAESNTIKRAKQVRILIKNGTININDYK